MAIRLHSNKLRELNVRMRRVAGVLEITVHVGEYTIHKQHTPETNDSLFLGRDVLNDWERILKPLTGANACYKPS